MNTKIKNIFNKNHGFLRAKDLTSRAEWYQLNKLIKQGIVTKIKRGLYKIEGDNMMDQVLEIANIVPNGLFCMFTAWNYYELVTYNPSEFHIAILKSEKVVLPPYPPVKIYYWTNKIYQLGATEIVRGGLPIKIYDLERSVCDAVRFRNKVGMDITTEVLKNYLKRKDRDLDKLIKYAIQLKIDNIMKSYLTVMI
ncbi:hypothetical protein FACS1894174_04630 [Bacteroidia bacterium]|nr:hypothetical protein FACS189455_2590 [Bacteroidia bacterium]GHV21349.1 hypothetical protein FACS1894174_04630 [Bacteroidia bacterium]